MSETICYPGDNIAVRYCGRRYVGVVIGPYRVRVTRRDYGWDLLTRVSFVTGSGRTHIKEFAVARWRSPRSSGHEAVEAARACELVTELVSRDTPTCKVVFPKRGRDDYYAASRARQEGLRLRRKGSAS